MSINIIDKKFNKRKKKKRNEMDLEDYAKKNNLNLDFSFSFGNSPEKAKKLDYFSNSYGSPKFDDSDSNINMMKQNSSSTNNTSIDDENKEKEKKEKKEKLKTKNKFENNFSNEVKEFNLDNNFYNNINNNKNDLYAYSNPNFSNFPKINKKLFTGIKEYYTDIDEKNINNINNIDKNHAKIIMGNYRNYQNALFCNYISNMNFMNMKIYNYNYNIYKLSLNACLQNIKEIEKNLEKTKTDIKNLESTTLQEMILLSQTDKLIPYFTKKTNIPNLESNNIKNSTILKHPYFYQNHNEEIEVNFILYLIEGLFLEENLIKDYILVSLLDRDGYVSLIQLEKHPQISKFKISLERLNEVFKEHRQNEVTETVETFDEILIRNKDWKNIKKKGKLLPSDKIKQNLLNEIGIIKHNKMKKLMGKKSELTQIQDKLYFRYHVLTQNVKQIQSHFSTINNFYNCQTSNFIFNNNNYNIYNNYNGNQRKTDY